MVLIAAQNVGNEPAPQNVENQPAPQNVANQAAPQNVVHQAAPLNAANQPAPQNEAHLETANNRQGRARWLDPFCGKSFATMEGLIAHWNRNLCRGRKKHFKL